MVLIAITAMLLSVAIGFYVCGLFELTSSLRQTVKSLDQADRRLKNSETILADLILALNANSSEHAKAQKLEVIMPKIVAEMETFENDK